MIKNARQYNAARKKIEKLSEALELSKKNPVAMDRDIYDAMIAGIESQKQEIQRDIDEYEKLANDKQLPSDTFEHIGKLLIQARISCGYTQKELADRAGLAPQQIQKYEANDYKSANLDRIEKIMHALGFNAIVELATDELINNQLSTISWNMDIIEEVKTETTVQEVSSTSALASVSETLSNPQWDFDHKEAA